MGRQISFFLYGEDQNDFDTFLKSCGEPVILPFYHHQDQLSPVADTLIRDSKKEGKRVYLVRPVDIPKMRLQYYEGLGTWLLKDNELPVLHYDRCVNTEREICGGRLYFEPRYLKNMEWVAHSDDFVKWADDVLKGAKRMVKKHTIDFGDSSSQEFLGKNAAVWVEKNKPESSMGGTCLKF